MAKKTSTPKDKDLRKLKILSVGDAYTEKFLVPTTQNKSGYSDEPDMASISLASLDSGVPFQTRIIEQTLSFPHADFPSVSQSDKSQINRDAILKFGDKKPSAEVAVCGKSLTSDPQGECFPIFIHELAPFAKQENTTKREFVWRIKRSYRLKTDQPLEELKEQSNTNYVEQATGIYEQLDEDPPNAILVLINDRDLGYRDAKEAVEKLFDGIKKVGCEDVVVVWHVRRPNTCSNEVFKQLEKHSLIEKTIVIVDQRCLKNTGINLRFDVSLEHSFEDFLKFSNDNELVRQLVNFPLLLIHFDYGVLHIRTSEKKLTKNAKKNKINEHVGRKIVAMDVHGLVNGPFNLSRKQDGYVTGRSFIYSFSIIAQIVRYYCKVDDAKLSDLFRFERCNSSNLTCVEQTALSQFDDTKQPSSIFANTLVDQGLDIGLLLSTIHFQGGFGPYGKGDQVPSTVIQNHADVAIAKKLLTLYDQLIFETKYGDRQQENSNDEQVDPETSPTKLLSTFAFRTSKNTDFPNITRLDFKTSLMDDSTATKTKRKAFTRVDLLTFESILTGKHKPSLNSEESEQVFNEAVTRIVTHGLESVVYRNDDLQPKLLVPYVRFGNGFETLDRREIDSLLSMRFLIANHVAASRPTDEPLSIGVFGPPGSGKNFVLKQIIKSIDEIGNSEEILVNLSQLSDVKQLARIFHRIQDRSLSGTLPIVFFDEFDSTLGETPLGWLKYFLSPMNDGEFFDGFDTYRLGPAIFVFAGGVKFSFKEFKSSANSNEDAKGPDFVSRLRGHLDVNNIDFDEQSENRRRIVVRRALMLRSLLKRFAPSTVSGNVISIEHDLVRAFLEVEKYEHGTRSIQAIIEMSRIYELGSFQRSSLPTKKQLDMHVDAKRFLAKVNNKS